MSLEAQYCVQRERINTALSFISLPAEQVLKLLNACHKDATNGINNKVQAYSCGRCEYEALGSNS